MTFPLLIWYHISYIHVYLISLMFSYHVYLIYRVYNITVGNMDILDILDTRYG